MSAFLVTHLGLVDDELVLAVAAVDDLDALAVGDDGLPVQEEVDGRLGSLNKLHINLINWPLLINQTISTSPAGP